MTSQSFCSDSHCYFFSVSLLGLHLSFFSQLVSDFSPLHVHLLLSAHSWVFLYYLMCTFPESWLLPDEPQQGRFVFPALLSESVNYSKPCLVLDTALWLIPQPQVHSLFLAKSSGEPSFNPLELLLSLHSPFNTLSHNMNVCLQNSLWLPDFAILCCDLEVAGKQCFLSEVTPCIAVVWCLKTSVLYVCYTVLL